MPNKLAVVFGVVLTSALSFGAELATVRAKPLPHLKVSENKRFLVTEDGKPFFYLADTGWELFHRLNRKEAVEYLDTRATQKFTVIQAVAVAELDGIGEPNAYGKLPLIDSDPTRPAVTAGAIRRTRSSTITGITLSTLWTRRTRGGSISQCCRHGVVG